MKSFYTLALLLSCVLALLLAPMTAVMAYVVAPRLVTSSNARSSCSTLSELLPPLNMHNNNNEKSKKKRGSGGGGGFAGALQELQAKTFPYAGILRPGKQTKQRVVLDESIIKPDYWQSGTPSASSKKPLLPWMVEVKTADEIVKMRAAGKLARHVLDFAGRAVAAGVTTDAIDALVHEEIIKVRVLFMYIFSMLYACSFVLPCAKRTGVCVCAFVFVVESNDSARSHSSYPSKRCCMF